MDESPAQHRILDAAEKLCQTRGYNGFSYRDLAEIVGIRSASIHYHFPTKTDLGKALVMRYRQKMETSLSEIQRREPSVVGRVRKLVAMLREMVRAENRVCLCGILAAEAGTLAPQVVAEVRRFFDECESWLAEQLHDGRSSGELKFTGSPASAARAVFAALEGAMLSARAFGEDQRLSDAGNWVIAQLQPA